MDRQVKPKKKKKKTKRIRSFVQLITKQTASGYENRWFYKNNLE